MTSNARGSKGGGPPSEPPDSVKPPSHAPSGVFRTLDDQEHNAGLQRWDDRWTVAEQFIREGFYYQLLRRPVGARTGPVRLTKREDDVLRLAAAGHGNKSIAQRLNVSASTVGVLLFRAAGKLNVASRSDLLSTYKEHAALPAQNEPRPRAARKPKH